MSIEKFKEELQEKIKKHPHKYVDATFEKIEKIVNIEKCELIIPSVRQEGFPAFLERKEEKGYSLSFDGTSHLSSFLNSGDWLESNMILKTEDISINLTGFYMTGTSNKLTLKREDENYFSGSYSINLFINDFSLDLNQKSFYRQVIEAGALDLYNYFQCEMFVIKEVEAKIGLFSAEINEKMYSFYTTTRNDKTFLIIDCNKKTSIDLFSKEAYCILVSIGFITGKFLQNECWFVESEDEEFNQISNVTFQTLRNSITSNYAPAYANPHSFLRGKARPESIPVHFKCLSKNVFSKLCVEILNNEKLLGAFIIFIEAHKLSIYSRGAGYSVTLEMLTQLIAEKNGDFKPIADEDLAKKFVSDLAQILEKYKTEISDTKKNPKLDIVDSLRILERKISGINSPTNKDKLSLPFKLYKIELTPGEDQAISHRNSFLHGFELRKSKKQSLSDMEVYGVVLNLLDMLNKLFLKYIGFEGYVINYHEFYINETDIDPEKIFVKI